MGSGITKYFINSTEEVKTSVAECAENISVLQGLSNDPNWLEVSEHLYLETNYPATEPPKFYVDDSAKKKEGTSPESSKSGLNLATGPYKDE